MTKIQTLNTWRNLPFISGLLALFLPVAYIEWQVLRYTGGVFMYPLDDPFIHMQVARNVALDGTWGINPGEFGSASSSILYTLLLTVLFKICTVQVIIPFLINCVAAIVLLWVVQQWMAKQLVSVAAQTLVLLLAVVLGPLPALVISGMEHVLQLLFCFLFLTDSARWLEEDVALDGKKNPPLPWQLLLWAILVTATRYEGVFLVAIVCFFILLKRRVVQAVLLGLVALLPLILFGIYSTCQGSYFLPNSVLVKAETAPLSQGNFFPYIGNLLINKLTVVNTDSMPVGAPRPGISLLATQRLLILLPLLFLLFRKQLAERPAFRFLILTLIACTIAHLCFAATGWFYRYEAYLVTLSILAGGTFLAAGKVVPDSKGAWFKPVLAVLLFALFFPFLLRSAASFTKAKQACINIYEQQYQVANFLRRYFNREHVAANDIGAMSFYTEVNMLDLWGLGNIEVARSKKGGYWTPGFLDSLARKRKTKFAVVYDEWFAPELLSGWKKAGSWTILNNVICGGETVSFYITDPACEQQLRKALEEHKAALPPTVTTQTY